MKIAFVGKGGSGKTTLSALFARYLASQNLHVLAVDADINQHFLNAITTEDIELKPTLAEQSVLVKTYLKGTNKRIEDIKEIVNSTPPANGSGFIYFDKQNPISEACEQIVEGIRFLQVGSFDENDLAVRCYHAKTSMLDLMLSHIIDKPCEYVVCDMTAGVDSFASGIFTKFDITFLVVEPTLKSIDVYNQYKKYAAGFDINLKVVGNKIENQEDIDFIKERVGEDLIACFHRSQFVRDIEKGMVAPLSELEEENKATLKTVLHTANSAIQEWEKKAKQNAEIHLKNCYGWANGSKGKDLTGQVDPEFSYQPYLLAG